MAERRFYCESLAKGRIALPPDEAHHARNVVRLAKGDVVRLFDGQGREASARVEAVSRDGVEVRIEQIESVDEGHRLLPITIAVAMPKAGRQDVLIEKCTELGARAIWPIITQRSVVRPRAGRVEHWKRISIAAAKQAGRSYLPHILSPQPFDDVSPLVEKFDLAVFGSTDPQGPPLLSCLGAKTPADNVLVLIGPEGGLTQDEQAALTKAGAIPVGLGRCVLRVDTAAITALAVLAAWIEVGTRP